MNIQRVKQGGRITWFNGLYMIILSTFYFFFFQINMRHNFSRVAENWGFFALFNPDVAYIFALFNIMIGILLIANGINIMYLSDFIIKRKDKLTWVILFISGIIGWAGLLTISILFRNPITIIANFIGWLTFVIGMILPIQYYLQKNYREY